MRRSDFGGVRDVAPFGEKAGIVLKPPEMVFNERKER